MKELSCFFGSARVQSLGIDTTPVTTTTRGDITTKATTKVVTTPVVTTTIPEGNVQILRLESQEGNWFLRGQTFHLQISYDVSPTNNGLSGIGVQIVLPAGVDFVNADVQFNNNLFGGVTANGNTISFQYVDIMSTNWPGRNLPLDLMILKLQTNNAYNGGDVKINFSSTAAGYIGWSPGLTLYFGIKILISRIDLFCSGKLKVVVWLDMFF